MDNHLSIILNFTQLVAYPLGFVLFHQTAGNFTFVLQNNNHYFLMYSYLFIFINSPYFYAKKYSLINSLLFNTMNLMANMEVQDIIKKLLWDYDIDSNQIYNLLQGKQETVFHFTKENFFLRMLEHLTWYEIITVLPVHAVKEMLTEAIIKKLRFAGMKENYEYARRVLHKLPVSSSIWYNKSSRETRFTLLSNRRDSS